MKRRFSIHRLADRELKDAARFYEWQQLSLGQEFLEDYEGTLCRARENPESAPVLDGGVRRLLFSRFPYAILYYLPPRRLRILAVAHLRHAMNRRALLVSLDARLSGPENMGLDEAMLRHIEAGGDACLLRLYGWSVPTLSLGYAQSFGKSVDVEHCAHHGIDVVRRVTGGRAVLHDREITYAVAMPYAWIAKRPTLRDCYGFVSDALMAALLGLGIPVERGRGDPTAASRKAACFGSTMRDELHVEGKKLVGSAQRRGKLGFLQHGSVLLRADVERHCGAMGAPVPERPRWIGIEDLGLAPPTMSDLTEGLARALCVRLDAQRRVDGDPIDAGDLVRKHASREWIQRVP